MHVPGALVESLARSERDLLLPLDLHVDRPFQDVHEHVGIVTMRWRAATRRILHGQHNGFLARDAAELVSHEGRDYSRSRRINRLDVTANGDACSAGQGQHDESEPDCALWNLKGLTV